MSFKQDYSKDNDKLKGMNKKYSPKMSDAQMFLYLQEVLLSKDREAINELKTILETRELLSERVNPIVEEHLALIKQKFPKEYEAAIEKIIDKKLKGSQEEILNVLYPKMGKMVQKYIQFQFQQLKENIDTQIAKVLRGGPIGWVRRQIFGINASDEILSAVDNPIIEEIYVIQRDSGLLIGSASVNQKIHEDVVAGMLTAIKAFAEDAFQKEKADLEMIQYDMYGIFLQNFPTYYIAVALGGSMTSSQKEKLENDLMTFAEREMTYLIKEINSQTNINIKLKLQEYFMTPNN